MQDTVDPAAASPRTLGCATGVREPVQLLSVMACRNGRGTGRGTGAVVTACTQGIASTKASYPYR